jgi:choline dehydrogenase
MESEVLILEAGPPDTDPNIWDMSKQVETWNTERDYAFKTTPQKGHANREDTWARGRTLGGSSSLSGMIYVRGHASDYDSWARHHDSGQTALVSELSRMAVSSKAWVA